MTVWQLNMRDSNPRPVSNITGGLMLGLGVILWLRSLELSGFTGYGDTEGAPGFMILIFGWFHPAWWANVVVGVVTFVYSSRRLGIAIAMLWVGVALSLTAFFIEKFPGNNGVIFGIGWGAVMWLASIQLIAMGKCFLMRPPNDGVRALRLNRFAFLFVFALTMGAILGFGFWQASVANAEDSEYFRRPLEYRTFLKLAPVCRQEQPSSLPLAVKTGGLKIDPPYRLAGDIGSGRPVFLLRGGVTPLLYGEFQIEATDATAGLLAVRPVDSKPAATLEIEKATNHALFQYSDGTRMRVRSFEDTSQFREFTWWNEGRASGNTCPRMRPDYKIAGSSAERFVVSVLGNIKRGNSYPGREVIPSSIRYIAGDPPKKNAPRPPVISASCEGRVSYKPELRPRGLGDLRLGFPGPLFVPHSNVLYFITLSDIGTSETRIACSANLMVVVGYISHLKVYDLLVIKFDEMKVQHWFRIDAPKLDGSNTAWVLNNARVRESAVQVDLTNYINGTKAELLVALEDTAVDKK